MHASFKAFLQNIIDYAGLFPPASLSMDTSVHNYAKYRNEPEAWMLSHFVVPASRLEELDSNMGNLFQEDKPLRLSILTRNSETTDDFYEKFKQDLVDIQNFMDKRKKIVNIEFLEARFPDDLYERISLHPVLKYLNFVAEMLEEYKIPFLYPFFEGKFSDEWRPQLSILFDAIAAFNKGLENIRKKSHCGPAGFKMRCGGGDASLIPSTEQVAFVIADCLRANIPLKATAGLHHPVRFQDPELDEKMHGFLNLFGAGILAKTHNLMAKQIQPVLEDQDESNFTFEDEHFNWSDWQAKTSQIEVARKTAIISFGSCSFDEPRQDLKKMGYLE